MFLMGQYALDLIVVFSAATAILSIYLFKNLNAKEKLFSYYIIAIGFFEILAYVWAHYLDSNNNLPGLHAYTLVQFILLTLFFKECLEELSVNFNSKWILVIGCLGIILNSMFVQSIFTYNSYSKSLVDLYVIIVSLSLFVFFIKDKNHDQVNMNASVSFVSAVFMQSATSIIIYMFVNVIIEMKESRAKFIMDLRTLINYIALFIIVFGLWQIYTRVGIEIYKSNNSK